VSGSCKSKYSFVDEGDGSSPLVSRASGDDKVDEANTVGEVVEVGVSGREAEAEAAGTTETVIAKVAIMSSARIERLRFLGEGINAPYVENTPRPENYVALHTKFCPL
jgi:hypothetical protein